ncbi:hypothetical protein HMPREF9123_0856 [Neisseria bacilliformis ATCC BAA-1200]|uniref:Uncharacterized protein n=1 Tax=Neisseria bacilliformis ATCC BAA-1200 TaxID=888742 RepID=F2BAV2_9NEIS|nr:hypothetical protein HMPREF9123_0856 [Neisseria bacilliformis ATCC BAA-1200]
MRFVLFGGRLKNAAEPLQAVQCALVLRGLAHAGVVRAFEFEAHVFDDGEVFFQKRQIQEAGEDELQAGQGGGRGDADGGESAGAALFGRGAGGVLRQQGEDAAGGEAADAAFDHDAAAGAGVRQFDAPAGEALHQPAGKAAFGQDAGGKAHAQAAFGRGIEHGVAVGGALVDDGHVRQIEAVADHGAPVGMDNALGGEAQMAVVGEGQGRGGFALGRRRVQPDEAEAFGARPCLRGNAAAFLDGLEAV